MVKIIAILMLLPVVAIGQGYSSGYGPAYTTASSYINSPASPTSVDTTKILVRHATSPFDDGANDWIYVDGFYDVIVEADDGTALRWGSTDSGSPTLPEYNIQGVFTNRANEDNSGTQSRRGWLWFDTSDIENGSRIEEAFIYFAHYKGLTMDMGTDGFYAFRADTIDNHYNALNSGAVGGQLGWFNMSHNEVDIDNSTAWTLSNLDDCHDYGPSSSRERGDGTIASLEQMRFDVTDAVQQIVDKGDQGRGILFYFYDSNLNTGNIGGFGASETPSWVDNGNPAFSAIVTSRRGAKPWGSTHVPVMVGTDDAHLIHAKYRDIMESYGQPFSEFISRKHCTGGAPYLVQDQRDSVVAYADVVLHSRDHVGLGNVTRDFDLQLGRLWTEAAFTDNPDTSYYVDFGWPGVGVSDSNYSLYAARELYDHGYRSARAATMTSPNRLGMMTSLGLDEYVNVYAIGSVVWSVAFGTVAGPCVPVADIGDTLKDWIDWAWTENGRSPLIMYGHGGNSVGECAEYEAFGEMVSFVIDHPGTGFMAWRDIISYRLSGATFLDPGDVTVANGATSENETAAAQYDSASTADSDPAWDEMWIGPKTD